MEGIPEARKFELVVLNDLYIHLNYYDISLARYWQLPRKVLTGFYGRHQMPRFISLQIDEHITIIISLVLIAIEVLFRRIFVA